jgi:hypothetical protein
MLEDMRKYVRAGLEALATGRSHEVSASVASGAQSIAEQMSALAAGFLEWSAEARASLLREVKDLVARQVREMGLASQRELDALRDRVARLESGDAPSPRRRSGTTSRPAARSKPKPTTKSKPKSAAGTRAGSTRRTRTPGSR